MAEDGQAVEVVGVRQRFGGIDVGASIAGALAALGVTVLLGGIAGAIGTVGYQFDVERGTDTLSAGGLAAGLVILLAAFLIGGWVAGRMARYDGGKNGLLTAVWFIVVAAILAGAGAWLGDKYDVFADLRLPQWFNSDATTTAAIISGIVAAIVMLAAGYLGGMLGSRYHDRADAYLAAEERDLLTSREPLEVIGDRGRETATDRRTETAIAAPQRDRADDIDLRTASGYDERRRDDVDLLEGTDLGTSSSREPQREEQEVIRTSRSTRPADADPRGTAGGAASWKA